MTLWPSEDRIVFLCFLFFFSGGGRLKIENSDHGFFTTKEMEKSEIGSFAMTTKDGGLQNCYWSSILFCAPNFAIRDAGKARLFTN